MLSTHLSRVSAIVLLLGGLVLLFAADVVLARLIPGFPEAGTWLGQLLGAAWLGLAALNWLSQATLLGGIYGRGVVSANATTHFVGAMVLLRLATRGDVPRPLLVVAIPVALLAVAYGWLLFRGPPARDLEAQRRAS